MSQACERNRDLKKMSTYRRGVEYGCGGLQCFCSHHNCFRPQLQREAGPSCERLWFQRDRHFPQIHRTSAIYQGLGANTVHLLPITAIGRDGSKGTLGSPYAIRNPYELDENQCEPSLGLDVKTEFKAFVEAAHLLGLRVVVEFVFRTSAKDGDWIKEHPDWYYWIKDSVEDRLVGSFNELQYGSPIFTEEELARIHRKVDGNDFGDLPSPHPEYKTMFTETPAVVEKMNGRYVGTLRDGTRVRIPGAFADWQPDDTQPPWNDVTYLKLYDHPEFNYIGYNTVRMYDSQLAKPEHVNRPLWQKIIDIIPYYQREFGIDGVMIDMGHALPPTLLQAIEEEARRHNPDFAFWEENFSLTIRSREQGYNAAVGYCGPTSIIRTNSEGC